MFFYREECPTDSRPQTFRSLYPDPDFLSLDVLLSYVTVYTISNKWSMFMHSMVSTLFTESSSLTYMYMHITHSVPATDFTL